MHCTSKYAMEMRHSGNLDCRNEVVAWLASIGAEKSVPTKKQTGLPTLSEEQWVQLQPKASRAAIVAHEPAAVQLKEPAAVQAKEPAAKAKEPSVKAKEPSAAKPKDSTAFPKPKGRPRCMPVLRHISCCRCMV